MNTAFHRLTEWRVGPYLDAIIGIFVGIAVSALSWRASIELIFSGLFPVRSAMGLIGTTIAGTVAIQFFVNFALTRWLWHERSIEWWMFAIFLAPVPLFFLRTFSEAPIETLLILCSIAASWAAVAGRTRGR